jgi:hypothetical protein
MTSKAYLVSWLGKGNIVWTPLEQASNGFSLSSALSGPLRSALDAGAGQTEALRLVQKILDPSMAMLNGIQTTVSVAAGFAVVGVGLQLAALAAVYRLSQKVERIDQKVKEIGGKFELHFLDRSIDHFLQWHQSATGLIPSAAIALEEDCYIALQELVGNKNLKLPSYLKLKIQSVAEAMDAYSRFLYATIHNGSLPVLADDRIRGWISEGRSIQKTAPVGGFVPQKLVLETWIQQLAADPKWKPENDGTLLTKSLERGAIERALPVSLLALQVTQALALSNSLEDQVQKAPERSLIVKVA